MKKLLLLIGFLVMTLPSFADKVLIGDLYYNLNDADRTAEVTYDKFYRSDNYSSLSGDLMIPESVTYNAITYKVTSIGKCAFYSCKSLTGSLTIPNSVTKIGNEAFYGCSGFRGSLTFGNSLTVIEEDAFAECSGFTGSLTIPDLVTTIGASAFAHCSGFNGTLTIGKSVTEIGDWAFNYCSGFTGSLTIPDSVTIIGWAAFAGWSNLSGSLTIGNSVSMIADGAFSDCSGITTVELGASLKSLGHNWGLVFSGCPNIKSVTCRSTTPATVYGEDNFEQTVLDNATLYVPSYSVGLYKNAEGWKEFKNIRDASATNYERVLIGDLYYNLDPATRTAEVTSSPNRYSNLKGNLIIPESVVYNGVNYRVTSIGESAFYGCTTLSGSLTIGNEITSIGDYAFYYCGFNGALTIGNSVTSIGMHAFNGCSNFTGTLTLPSSVTGILSGAFLDCSGFTGTLSIPDSVIFIDNQAFQSCKGISSIEIGESLKGFGLSWGKVFYDCPNIKSVTCRATTPATVYGQDNFDQIVLNTATLIVPSESVSLYKNAEGWKEFKNIRDASATIYERVLIGDLYYNLNPTTHAAEVTYDKYFSSNNYSHLSGDLVIPESVDYNGVTYYVTSIGASAFSNCSGLTGSLTIPNSVTKIGNVAFFGCGFRGSLTLGSSLMVIAEDAFTECSGFTGALTIPDSVTSIEHRAFSGCSGFTGTLTIGNSVASIGDWAFSGCIALTDIVLGESLVSLGNSGGGVFAACYNIESVTCHAVNPPTIYGPNNFEQTVLNTATLIVPSESVNLYKNAEGWKEFKNIRDASATIYERVLIGDLYYNLNPATRTAEVTSDKLYSSDNYSYLSGSLVIPESVVYNGASYKVTSIADHAFFYCNGISGSLTIPSSVISIGDHSFDLCDGLTGSLTIGNSVISIGAYAFSGCRFTGSLTIPNSVTSIGDSAFRGCSGFTGALTIPNSVTSIGYSAFESCNGFTGSLIIGNSVTSIGGSAFENCNGFTGSLTIPNSVTSIEFRAFDGCSGFTGSLTIGNSVASIGDWAFRDCCGFTEIELGKSLESLGYLRGEMFAGCPEIKSITCHATNPPAVYGDANFEQTVLDNATLYVPSYSVGLYKNAEGWKEFKNILDASATNYERVLIGDLYYNLDSATRTAEVTYDKFWDADNYSNITDDFEIPEFVEFNNVIYQVTSIGDYAFAGYTGFTGSLTIPNSVTSIGTHAFNSCSGFTGSLTIPHSVTSIGVSAFSACEGFTDKLTIGDSVTSIESYAFSGCSGFTEIEFGKSVESVGFNKKYQEGRGNVFAGCYDIRRVTCNSDNPPIVYGPNNFEQTVLDNATLIVPRESVGLYRTANVWKEFMNIKDDSSDIQSVGADDGDGVHVMVDGHEVTIVNAPAEATVRVYDLQGALVAMPGAPRFTIEGSGVYMVAVGHETFKISIR